MRMSHRARLRLTLIALLSLLCTQLSVAAYACPKGMSQAAAAAGDDVMREEGCEGMDPVQSMLCHKHCHGPSLSADASSPPPPMLAGVHPPATAVLVESLTLLLPLPPATRFPPGFLARAQAPPLRVLHCCFLI